MRNIIPPKEVVEGLVAHVAKKTMVFCIIVAILVYAFNVYIHTVVDNCRYEKSTEDNGKYTAELCYSFANFIRLRLYRTGENDLLAERMLEDPNDPSIDPLLWLDNAVLYDRIDGRIKLPPTRIDWFRARLP